MRPFDASGVAAIAHVSVPRTLEHDQLEALEHATGHTWVRNEDGAILYHPMEGHCEGPRCKMCGYSFCINCNLPFEIARVADCWAAIENWYVA